MAVHARHIDVAEHQIEGLGTDSLERLFRRTDSLVVVSREHQRIRQCLAQRAVILDQ